MRVELISVLFFIVLFLVTFMLPKYKDGFGVTLNFLTITAWSTLICLIVAISVNIETQKECLKGNNFYKTEIQYELKDSVYVPVDTIFIKVNK